ncbi:MAG: DEAD/DEAH box helicase, partial [bacterium]
MYDEYARQLIDSIPELPDLDRDFCRRALSAAYLHVLRSNLSMEENAIPSADLPAVKLTLRGLADALESVAVFDDLNQVAWSSQEREASAFVAGEALSLLSHLQLEAQAEAMGEDPMRDEATYVAVEAALLYMIGGYDINAFSTVRDLAATQGLSESVQDSQLPSRLNGQYLLDRLLRLCRGNVRRSSDGISPVRDLSHSAEVCEELFDGLRARFYQMLGDGVDAYLDWLGGYRADGLEVATGAMQELRQVLHKPELGEFATPLADIHHLLNLVLEAIERTKERALVHNVPQPHSGNPAAIESFREYLYERARGDETHRGRPFLWPSTAEYVGSSLPGPRNDAVVAMPTGSGKSFIAELAAAHAVCRGWVLYLAPTNALTHQVRRELRHAFKPFDQVTVRAFVGADEYTTLSEEHIDEEAEHFVAVMTPEKCALALRLYPEHFSRCSLCVFDECHLLNDEDRGLTADVILAQLTMIAPDIRFLLMSAMLSNADDLAEWLGAVHEAPYVASPLRWRPSRTLRGMLVVDRQELLARFPEAKRELQELVQSRPRRRRLKFEVPLGFVVGLSGPWTREGAVDYRTMQLPLAFEAEASVKPREAHGPQFRSWKNPAARQLSELLASHGLPTLCLVLTSRHHTFSSANKVSVELPGTTGEGQVLPPLAEAWLAISDAELGTNSALRDLLSKGISVHSSAMLQTEQAASEWMFAEGKTSLMFATPTLAQGLNLPAIGVVVAGTSMGDPRNQADTDGLEGVSRVEAVILNSFGRAGRPGFSNQGIALLVTDDPYAFDLSQDVDPSAILDDYSVLGEEDAAVDVRSPVRAFVRDTLEEQPELGATRRELALVSLLAELDSEEDKSASGVLSRTFGVYQIDDETLGPVLARAQDRIREIRRDFLEQPAVPPWINSAAMKAGVDLFRTWHVWDAYQSLNLEPDELDDDLSVSDWFGYFVDMMTLLPAWDARYYLADPELRSETILTRLRDAVSGMEGVNTIPWEMPDGWRGLWRELGELVRMYMQGASYAELASVFLGLDPEEPVDNSRSSAAHHPIPKVFGFLRQVVDTLAIDAGCLAAVHELGVTDQGEPLPDGLQALPLCIRYGCDPVDRHLSDQRLRACIT